MQYKMQPEMLRLLVLGRQRMAIRNRAKHAALHQHVAMPRKVCTTSDHGLAWDNVRSVYRGCDTLFNEVITP